MALPSGSDVRSIPKSTGGSRLTKRPRPTIAVAMAIRRASRSAGARLMSVRLLEFSGRSRERPERSPGRSRSDEIATHTSARILSGRHTGCPASISPAR